MKSLLWAAVLGALVLLVPAGEGAAAREKTIYSFCSQSRCADGSQPNEGLIDVNGTLYGTTYYGGVPLCGGGGCGTLFSLDPGTGAETVLYSFCKKTNCTDGARPFSGPIAVNGTLYGTTGGGGNGASCAGGCGTVFSLDPSTGAETVLYTFCIQTECADGANPAGSLIDVNGTLYGATAVGGANCTGEGGCGTIFSLDPGTGAETVLYSFCSKTNCADGAFPFGDLIDVNGTLYGTAGGGANCTGIGGCGTIFSLAPGTGAETVLYSFCSKTNCTDGAIPAGSLIDVNGVLYGTTYVGGLDRCARFRPHGCGTVFSLDLSTGAEAALYSFCSQTNCTDGAFPEGGLINVNGVLYGTTGSGGANVSRRKGGGTVFSLDLSIGAETVLYSFCGRKQCRDGSYPGGSLLKVRRKLYGTTLYGGVITQQQPQGAGTIFWIKTP